MIAARLDALSTGSRAVLDAAAVLGRSGPVNGLRALVANQPAVVYFEQDLAALADADLLTIDGPRYEFPSDLVKDVAYGILTKAVRATRHRDIARFIESAVFNRTDEPPRNSEVVAIADHYSAAARLVSELDVFEIGEATNIVAKALDWISQAGDRALDAGEPADAELWFSQGLEMSDDCGIWPAPGPTWPCSTTTSNTTPPWPPGPWWLPATSAEWPVISTPPPGNSEKRPTGWPSWRWPISSVWPCACSA